MSDSYRDMPLVSVVMSCFNAASWLDESIRSVLDQSFADFEFIIINDGSTDDSLSIMKRFGQDDHRIFIIDKPNSGLAESLNLGVERAHGKWIARMDADDICEPTRLARQVDYVSSHPNVVFVGSGLTVIDEHGFIGVSYNYPTEHSVLVSHLITARRFPPHASAFYRRDAACEVGLYRKRIKRAEDWDLWLRLSARGSLASIPEPLMLIRKHSGQISLSAGGRDQIVDCRLAIISYLLRAGGHPDPIVAEEDIYHRFVNWTIKRLETNGYFEYHSWKAALHSKNLVSISFGLIVELILHPVFAYQLIKERIFGDNFCVKATTAWVSKSFISPKSVK